MCVWLFWFVSYIYKSEYVLRAERPEAVEHHPIEHEEDRQGKFYKALTFAKFGSFQLCNFLITTCILQLF